MGELWDIIKATHYEIQEKQSPHARYTAKLKYIEGQIINIDVENKIDKITKEEAISVFKKDIADELIEVFGERWEDIILCDNYREYERWCPEPLFKANFDIAREIWLSKQGAVSWKYRKLGGGYLYETNIDYKREDIIRKAIFIIEENMKKKHIDLPLVICQRTTTVQGRPFVTWNWKHRDIMSQEVERFQTPAQKKEIEESEIDPALALVVVGVTVFPFVLSFLLGDDSVLTIWGIINLILFFTVGLKLIKKNK